MYAQLLFVVAALMGVVIGALGLFLKIRWYVIVPVGLAFAMILPLAFRATLQIIDDRPPIYQQHLGHKIRITT